MGNPLAALCGRSSFGLPLGPQLIASRTCFAVLLASGVKRHLQRSLLGFHCRAVGTKAAASPWPADFLENGGDEPEPFYLRFLRVRYGRHGPDLLRVTVFPNGLLEYQNEASNSLGPGFRSTGSQGVLHVTR